jgi:hypothetical protein
MRTTGLCLALLASLELVALSTPAIAQGNGSDAWPPRKAFVDPGTAAPADTSAAPAGTVMVHVNSDTPVTLQHRTSDSSSWETLCTSPCDVRAPVGDQYQIVREGSSVSKAFALDASKGDNVTLDVKTPGKGQKAGGWVLAGTGGALFIGGWVVILANLGNSAISGMGQDDSQTHDAHNNGMFIGTALIVAGLCAGIAGTSMVIGADKADVGGNVQAPPPSSGKSDQVQRTAEVVPPTAPSFYVPILQGRF